MALDLLAIEPNKVSTDLSGYITYIYGEGKTGKTTMASKMKNALLLAFEPGYKAIPGIRAQDITSWAQVKQVQRQLRDPKVKEAYKSIVVDTVDIAAALCEKYVCSQAGVERLNDVPYGQGWTKVKKEFEETFRAIAAGRISRKHLICIFLLYFYQIQLTTGFRHISFGKRYNFLPEKLWNVFNEIPLFFLD